MRHHAKRVLCARPHDAAVLDRKGIAEERQIIHAQLALCAHVHEPCKATSGTPTVHDSENEDRARGRRLWDRITRIACLPWWPPLVQEAGLESDIGLKVLKKGGRGKEKNKEKKGHYSMSLTVFLGSIKPWDLRFLYFIEL